MRIFSVNLTNYEQFFFIGVGHKSKNENRKNIKYDFSLDSVLCAYFM